MKDMEDRPFYRYIPKRALIVDGIFLAVLAAAGMLLLAKGAWPLAAVLGFMVLKTLGEAARESVIELRSQSPNLIYARKYLWKRKTEKIPFQELEGVSSEITSMWRGNISEKLVLEASGKKYLLHPHYSAGSPATAGIHHQISRLMEQGREDLQRQLREEAERQRRLEKKARKKRVTKPVWGMLEMSVKCPRCQSPVPVNGPWTDLGCPDCGDRISLSPDNWVDLLEDVRNEIAYNMEPGTGSESTIMGVYDTRILYSRMVPYCPVCKEDLPSVNLNARILNCSCGYRMEADEPPEWFHRVFKGVKRIAGEERTASLPAADPEPVSMTCPSCGAGFDTTGTVRNPSCPSCGTSVFLQDDLWFHFHPVPVRKRWFVGFSAGYEEKAD